MVKEQSPKALYGVRGKLYELLANCIPPELILRTLLLDLLKRLDDELKVETTSLAALYEHRLQARGEGDQGGWRWGGKMWVGGAVGRRVDREVRSGSQLEYRCM